MTVLSLQAATVLLIAGGCAALFFAIRSSRRISAGDRDQIKGGQS